MPIKESMTIAIGADHRGFHQKQFIIAALEDHTDTISWHDVGAFNEQRSDYPLFARAVCSLMRKKTVTRAILLCGTGVGMAIVANRYCGIYAAIAWNEEVARLSRHDDNSNILVLPSDFITDEQAVVITRQWLSTEFSGDRYAQRLEIIDHLDCQK